MIKHLPNTCSAFRNPRRINESYEEYHAVSLNLKHHAVYYDIYPGWSANIVDSLTAWHEHY